MTLALGSRRKERVRRRCWTLERGREIQRDKGRGRPKTDFGEGERQR